MIAIPTNEIQEFVLLLRERGIQVGVSEHLDAQSCYSDLFQEYTTRDESTFFLALRSSLVKKKDDYDTFARAFEDFFVLNKLGRGVNIIPQFAREDRPAPRVERSEILGNIAKDRKEESGDDGKTAILSLYSSQKSKIPTVDIPSVEPFQPEEIRFISRKLRKINRLNQALPGRRKSSYSQEKSRYVDWRKLAKLLSSNPDAMPKIQFRNRKLSRSKFVVMADVSGSMLKEAELLINSLFTACRRFHGTEVFVFSTKLSRLTSLFTGASPSLETVKRFYSRQTEIESRQRNKNWRESSQSTNRLSRSHIQRNHIDNNLRRLGSRRQRFAASLSLRGKGARSQVGLVSSALRASRFLSGDACHENYFAVHRPDDRAKSCPAENLTDKFPDLFLIPERNLPMYNPARKRSRL